MGPFWQGLEKLELVRVASLKFHLSTRTGFQMLSQKPFPLELF